MKPEIPVIPCAPPQSLDQLLNSAVVLNWDAVTQSFTPGRVRVEYHIGADGALEYLKLWSHAREYWSLICEYSAHLSWSDGPRFCNGYHSRSLSRLLQSIMMNQTLGNHQGSPNTNGTLEVGPPTAEDVDSAKLRVSETFQPIIAARGPKRAAEAAIAAQKNAQQ
jgi:hypothetical protein